VAEQFDVFLSYSRNDLDAATLLLGQLEKAGLKVFRDQESIRAGELWLNRLQEAVDACGAFVVLVGRDGVRRWIGAETQVALGRYFGPHDDAKRLPIFPVLLGDTDPAALPAFLRLFQGTAWNGTDALPESLLEQIRARKALASKATFEGCPFVGLDAYRPDQAQLFFGRQKETLDALACFDPRPGNPDRPGLGDRGPIIRWLEIDGNSGSGKSSLMNAGLLPLVDQGWLWPRTGFETWRRIGPMMPGECPVTMLAEHLARIFEREMADVRRHLQEDDERALADWLRGRKPDEETAFLLAVDQFEELFTFADPAERKHFDRLLATALGDADCPLFVISTVRSDFLDQYDELLPRLVAVRNRRARRWTLPPISPEGLREIVSGPARLAGLDVREIQEAMVAEAQDEPGALPLVENALRWLWEQRTNNRLSGRLLADQGGLAGVLSRNADDLLQALGRQSDLGLELLFRLVKIDPEGRRHTRQRMPLAEAVSVAGGGEAGRALINRLAGERTRDGGRAQGPLRLITISGGAESGATVRADAQWVNLIHETLIRSKGLDAEGKPQLYWPTLWNYIEKHLDRAVWRARVRAETRSWLENGRKTSYLWSHESVRDAVAALTQVGPAVELSDDERAFLGPIDPAAMLAELERPETSHKRRALIGERLDVLGDPRRGIGLANGLPEIDLQPIRGGEVTIEIRSDPSDPNSHVEKTLTRTVPPFSMSRYPITIAQFRAFLDDCHRDGHWRLPPGFPENPLNSYPPPRHHSRCANHPADMVNWFDACAFCHWLGARLRAEIRLPTEFEWQLAATGGDSDRTYPWGPDWDPEREPWRANTFESGLGQATAVGCYPAGKSADSLFDLAGTVWEWCLNEFDDPDATAFHTERRARVRRGGSWCNTQLNARCADRYGLVPIYRNEFIGFRVVCSSPI
jgi:formylglycine-generating enzyme required for sulfatase activity